ncbi:hypothetical protein GN244_ATG15360 [Phytophthora infestans]|uniref:Uncharacterized protein n=1 Tax=Phytophthora infestans TaxID=4787 RepID=A0A833T2R1_PHYIN|nr:hypothetical protein GN244_ATG15360 [Phytophthora infestans]
MVVLRDPFVYSIWVQGVPRHSARKGIQQLGLRSSGMEVRRPQYAICIRRLQKVFENSTITAWQISDYFGIPPPSLSDYLPQ